MGDAEATARVLAAVALERDRQRATFGEAGDRHPDVGQPWWLDRDDPRPKLAPTRALREMVTAGTFGDEGAGWLELLAEELGEARDAAEVVGSVVPHDRRMWRERLRAELVQVAAVAVAWVEDLERREAAEGKGDGRG